MKILMKILNNPYPKNPKVASVKYRKLLLKTPDLIAGAT
jgi:hypothetical protein